LPKSKDERRTLRGGKKKRIYSTVKKRETGTEESNGCDRYFKREMRRTRRPSERKPGKSVNGEEENITNQKKGAVCSKSSIGRN